jgi:plasmid stability protein
VTELHIRVPDDLAKKIKAQAASNLRSIAAEVVVVLSKAMK